MVNINSINAALWKIQIAKLEQQAFNTRYGLEGSFGATQNMAVLTYQEQVLQNAISLHRMGKESSRITEIEYMANQINASYPSVR